MRKLTLLDVSILVAAVALGLALVREPYRMVAMQGAVRWKSLGPWLDLLHPLIAPTTVAVGVLALRQPRPRLRRLFRQPGLAACLAVSTAFLLRGVEILVHFWKSDPIPFVPAFFWMETGQSAFWMETAQLAAYAVAGSWATLFVVGMRRGQGLNRLGIVLGLIWLAAAIIGGLGQWWVW